MHGAADELWLECRTPLFPRRTIDGRWTSRHLSTWRRTVNGNVQYRQEPPAEITLWHKCVNPIIPRRTLNGVWTSGPGQTWRRWNDHRWEYLKDAETEEEFRARETMS